MPPKKDKSKGKRKNSPKTVKLPEPAASETIDESKKQYYLVQIRDLELRVAKYQQKCYELEIANGGYQEKFDQLAGDRDQMVSFLKQQLQQKQDEIADLRDRVLGLQQQKDAEKENYEQDIQKLRHEFQETKDQLTRENMNLNAELQSLEEFKVQKEDLLRKLAEMRDELADKQANFKEQVFQLERKNVIDKDRVKKETIQRLNHVAAEFRKASNKQMAETTKRTIRENVSINTQLTKVSDKTMELLQENESLSRLRKEQQQQVDIMEQSQQALATKNAAANKLVRMLTARCAQQQTALEQLQQQLGVYQESERAAQPTADERSPEQLQAEAASVARLAEDLAVMTLRYEGSMKNSEELERSYKALQRTLGEAAVAIQVYIGLPVTHSRAALSASRGRPDPLRSPDLLSPEERLDQLLQQLLQLLNSGVQLGQVKTQDGVDRGERTEAGVREGWGRNERGEEEETHEAVAAGQLPLYRMGDLGLIPRAAATPASATMRELSATSRHKLSALRRVLRKSEASQTDESLLLKAAWAIQQTRAKDSQRQINMVKREAPLKTLHSGPTPAAPPKAPNLQGQLLFT